MKRPFVLSVVVGFPLVVALGVLLSGSRWFPAGDMAQAELHMRGFFRHPPLVGAAGRIVSDTGFQGSHPGPSLWLAMLPVYLIGGRTSASLLAAVVSVHMVSIVSVLYLAFRRGGALFLLLMSMGITAILRSAGPDFMIEPWNPWLALLPFGLFMMLVLDIVSPRNSHVLTAGWSVKRRLIITLCSAVLVGSHAIQCHAGYALLVAIPLLVAVVVASYHVAQLVYATSHSAGYRRYLKSTASVSMWVLITGIVIWSPVVVDQIRRRPGNLTILWQHFGSPSEPTLGILKVWSIVVTQVNVLGPWLWGPSGVPYEWMKYSGFAAFLLLLMVTSLLVFRRGNGKYGRELGALIGFLLIGILSLLRIFGPYYEYTIRWMWLIVMMILVELARILIACASANTVGRWNRLGERALFIGLVGAVLLTTLQTFDRVKLPGATDSRILAGLIDDTILSLNKDMEYQVRFYDPYTLNATGFGLVLELERRGFDARVDPEYAAAALPHRTAPMTATDVIIWVVVGPAVEKADSDPALDRIAYFNPRSPSEQVRASELLDRIALGLRSAGRDDLVSSLHSPGASLLFTEPPLPESTAVLVRELIRMGQPTAIYLMDPWDIAHSLG